MMRFKPRVMSKNRGQWRITCPLTCNGLDIPELISADQRCNHGIGNRSQRHPAKVVVPVDGRHRRPPIGLRQPQVAGPVYR